MPLRVVVVAEYYPRPSMPSQGIWAHRQAMAVRDQGIEVSVLALERPLPPLSALRSPGKLRRSVRAIRSQPRTATLDGIDVQYVRFFSPPRPTSYSHWGAWAARPLATALDELRERWPFDLIHAHYAIPSGDAAAQWIAKHAPGTPLVVSVHGGDLSYAAARSDHGRERVTSVLRGAAAVAANSRYTRDGIIALTGPLEGLEIVHLGADLPALGDADKHEHTTLITIATLEARKNQQSVVRALATLSGEYPQLRYVVVGDGPDRERLEQLAESLGVADRVHFTGPLAHPQAMAELRRCHVHVLPSADEPFGVAHIEAMAAGLPAIAGAGTGADDIAAAGEGVLLVPPGDDSAIARAIAGLIGDPAAMERFGAQARTTIAASFTWARCGEQTAALYRRTARPG